MAIGDETLRDFPATRIRDPLLGTTIDDYVVEAIIGTGAMGIVYRGVHQVIGKAVAIKVLKPDYATDPDMVERLKREARTVNAIRHPAIVDIFGFGTLKASGQPYIVMDLLEGEPLDAFIKREAPVPPKVAYPILDELLGALAAAHGVGVIHRDLKPGNVFVESHPEARSRIKVIDFGLARQANRAGGSVKPTNPGTLLGTPAFMAPEQVVGTKVTPATDLYAVGGIAYQLLTGHLPHEAPTAIEVISQKMQHDPIRPRQWNPKIEEDLDAWIMALLRREPADRPASVDEVRAHLRRAVDARTQDSAPSVKRRTNSQPPYVKQRSGLIEKPLPPPPARGPLVSAAGVVPRVSDKTVLLEGGGAPSPLQGGNPVERTTDQQVSPFAQTAMYGAPAVTPPAPNLTPPMSPPSGDAITGEDLRLPDELRALRADDERPQRTEPDNRTMPQLSIPSTLLLPAEELLGPGGREALNRPAPPAATPSGPVPSAPLQESATSQELSLPGSKLPWVLAGTVALLVLALIALLIVYWA